jgi:hypothetical protein
MEYIYIYITLYLIQMYPHEMVEFPSNTSSIQPATENGPDLPSGKLGL